MECRCAEITILTDKKNNLAKVKEKNSTFNQNIDSGKTEREYLVEDSWNAAKSEMLKQDTRLLPGMTNKVEQAHNRVISVINTALVEMENKLKGMYEEDEAYHNSLEHLKK